MASDSGRQSNRASLRVSSPGGGRPSDEPPFKKMLRARTAEGVLNAFREIEAEKGIILCSVRLICGAWHQEFTYDQAAGNTYECNIGVEVGETRIVAKMSSPAGEQIRQEADDAALLAVYLIDRLDLQARLGVWPQLTGRAIAAPAVNGLRGESEHIKNLAEIIFRVIERGPSSVIILGESGTGKELIARELHYRSPRAGKSFVAINCSALPESLIETELFGHEQGAFTDAKKQKPGIFEQAKGGTVFLDEIGEMSLSLQAKLLRVLETRTFRRVGGVAEIPFDAHVVAASNRYLPAEVEAGRFRGDLFYRLAGYTIELPPLRERGNDLFLIANYFIEEFNQNMNRRVRGLAPEVIELFRRHPWPGNVRELKKVIEHAMTEGTTDLITADQLPHWAFKPEKTADRGRLSDHLREGESFKQYQCRTGLMLTQLVLDEYQGNHEEAARRLRWNRAGLWNWRRRAQAYLNKRRAG